MKRWLLKICLGALLVSILLNTNALAETPPLLPPSKFDHWLTELAFLESNNTAHIKHLDVNGRYSFGCLQFQLATLQRFSPGATEKNAYDCDFEKRVARAMLTQNPGLWTMWYTSIKKKGLGRPPVEPSL